MNFSSAHNDHLDPDRNNAQPDENTPIRNLSDLAAYIGANEATPASLNHRLYKDTACGAWLTCVFPGSPAGVNSYTAEVRMAPDGGGVVLHKLEPANEDVAAFLGFFHEGLPAADERGLGPFASIASYTQEAREVMAASLDSIAPLQSERITEIRSCIGCVRITVTVGYPERELRVCNGQDVPEGLDLSTCVAVEVGSIVEGSEAEVGPYRLAFPFSCEKWDETVERVESEVDDVLAEQGGEEN